MKNAKIVNAMIFFVNNIKFLIYFFKKKNVFIKTV